MTPNEALHKLLREKADEIARRRGKLDYLEIGVFEGDGLAAVLACPAVRLAVGVDDWSYANDGFGKGSATFVWNKLKHERDRLLVITGNSHEILRGMAHSFDLILVDGDHTDDGAMDDLRRCWTLLSPHGIMLFDDCDHREHKYLRGVAVAFAESHSMNLKFHKIGNTVAEFTNKHD